MCIRDSSSTSIQSSLLKGLSKTTKAVGKIVERIPVVGDTQADEDVYKRQVLMRICQVFHCDIGDICEVILDED